MRLRYQQLIALLLAILIALAGPAVAQQEARPVQTEGAKPDDARSSSADTPRETTPAARSQEQEAASQQQLPLPDQTDKPIEQIEQSQPAVQRTETTPSQYQKKPGQEKAAAKPTPAAGKTIPRAPRIPPLPADSATTHVLDIAGRTLQFEAVAGSLPLTNTEGRIQARMAYISYAALGTDAKSRPVAFAFNGGPGSASAWLHLGTLGPWRLPMDGDAARPSAPGTTIPNAETWLDFADLVLIDPVGTGYSRFENETAAQTDAAGAGDNAGNRRSTSQSDLQKQYWSINGDVGAFATFISKWLTMTGRHASPKVIVGESYGGFRGPKIARALQSDHGVGVNLLVLVSPVLDYGFLRRQRHLPFNAAALLPSLSAASLELRGKTPTSALMREAEEYARGEYLTDMLRGPRDTAAVARVVKRVSALTSLPAATIAKYGGMLDSPGYRREINQEGHKVASAYDASVKGLDPEPGHPSSGYQDPFITALRAPLTSAILNLYSQLNWRPDARYQLANTDVSGHWQYGNSPSSPEAVSDLKSVLALDTRLRVLVTHGYTDLVTPYFASTLVLDQLPTYGDARRIVQVTYPGGHMFYSRDNSRAAFREDVLIMLAASLNGEPQTR
ncbi:MAG: S10 family peptidase [Hyphomicrobiaceae bacterium]